MVHGNHGDVLSLAQSQQAGSDERSACKVKRPHSFFANVFLELGGRAGPRRRPLRSCTVSGTSSLAAIDLARNPAIGDQRGPQDFVSAYNIVQGSLEGRNVKPAHEPDGCRDVIRRSTRFELIEEPEPLLCERSRQRTVAIDRFERRC